MAIITKVDPDPKTAPVVQVDVDAKDNWEAIDVLEKWASDNGFARVNENFLQIIMRADGSRIFRGYCYRLTNEHAASVQLQIDAADKRAAKISSKAPTSHSSV